MNAWLTTIRIRLAKFPLNKTLNESFERVNRDKKRKEQTSKEQGWLRMAKDLNEEIKLSLIFQDAMDMTLSS